MPLLDSNVWLALALSGHDFNRAASNRFRQQKSDKSVLFCRATQRSFLRLLTTREVLVAPYGTVPLTNDEAWSAYQGFISDKRIEWIEEPCGLEVKWKTLAARRQASPKLWADAYLAAFAMAGGYQLVTTDQGFKHFKGLNFKLLTAV